jgi:hypothetical protein
MRKLLTILTLLGVVTCPVFAGSITDLGLFNTGMSSNWKVGGGAVSSVPDAHRPGPWAPNTPGTSNWISTVADADHMVQGSGDTVSNYTMPFTVPSVWDLSTIVITGRWALDDYGTASVGSTVFAARANASPGPFYYSAAALSAQTFTISGLTSATNTLTFAVTNKHQDPALNPSGINPSGLRVEFDPEFSGRLIPTGIPEPGTLALLGGGLLALGFFRRRR